MASFDSVVLPSEETTITMVAKWGKEKIVLQKVSMHASILDVKEMLSGEFKIQLVFIGETFIFFFSIYYF